ncbi:M24 family metallopeptidase [bacterium]|nr:M24 family metallopeptidase [bacterium]NDC94061.1 M24 family metallopeptidase [bacterium]NDD82747.1 M24 family metallopeptidase [bacterium]NDG29167.1 M24 family metallopeptidase [bacterium]
MADLTKYNDASKIAKGGFEYVKGLVLGGEWDIPTLCRMCDDYVLDSLSKVYKKENKGIAFPCCVSPNGIVGYNCTGTLVQGDLVKVELGVDIGGCTSIVGGTFVNGQGTDGHNKFISLLETLAKGVLNEIKIGNTNIDVKTYVESLCTEHSCFPIENCMSYQHFPGHIRTDESKYIVLNHKKYYDDDDMLLVEPNICFEFLDGEVYHINLTIVPDNETEHKYTFGNAQILRFNDLYYSLKLKHSKQFNYTVKKDHGTNAFRLSEYTSPGDRLGMRECLESGILDSYPVKTVKENYNVYFKKFTVVIHNGSAKKLL